MGLDSRPGSNADGSCSTPIDSSNIGFQLLKKHGWKEGTGLGISQQGRLEPIQAFRKQNKRGLGVVEPKAATRHSKDDAGDDLERDLKYCEPQERSLLKRYKSGENKEKLKKRKICKNQKRCYNCGDIGHEGELCEQFKECFICLKKGHLIIDCPDKNVEGDSSFSFCLKCGSKGHDMFSCSEDYNSADLKDIQCYICKEFGHLNCVDYKTDGPTEASCYKCGQSAHFGSDCTKLNEIAYDPQKVLLCSKCGQIVHYNRACIKRHLKAARKAKEEKNDAESAAAPKSAAKVNNKSRKARQARKWKKMMAMQTAYPPQIQQYWAGSNLHYGPQIGPYYAKPGSNVWLTSAASTVNLPNVGPPSHIIYSNQLEFLQVPHNSLFPMITPHGPHVVNLNLQQGTQIPQNMVYPVARLKWKRQQ